MGWSLEMFDENEVNVHVVLFSAIRERFLVRPPAVQVDPIIEYDRDGTPTKPRLRAQYGQPFAIEALFYELGKHLPVIIAVNIFYSYNPYLTDKDILLGAEKSTLKRHAKKRCSCYSLTSKLSKL